MDRYHNPFTPGAGALPPELAGRTQVVEDGRVLAGRTLLGRYEKGLMLIGLRGVGKTVLLKHLAEAARREKIIPVTVEVRNSKNDLEELSLRLREALSLIDFGCKVKAKVHYAFSVLRNFVKTFSLNIGDFGLSVETAPGVAGSGNMEFDLSEVLLACAQAAKESGTAIGLYVDEFQNLELSAMRGMIVALHRAAQEALPLYLVGSGLPSIRGLVGKSKTYAERMFNYAEIGALTEEESAAAIAIPLNENGLGIASDALSAIYVQTKGYPYFLQEFGYQIWIDASGREITASDIARISPCVQDRLDGNFFDVRFDRVSNSERQFLRAMADCPNAVEIAAVAERLGRTVAALSPMRASLIRKGMLYSPMHGQIAYTVPQFGEYMKRVMP